VHAKEEGSELEQTDLAPLSWGASQVKSNQPKSQQKSQGTIVALDGVRAIAALLVVSVHVSEIGGVPWNINQNPLATAFAFLGRTGVVLFFVLSGFLLFMPYARALLFQEAWPSPRKFYLRRIFRIWPGYYFTLAVMILLFDKKYLQPAYWKQLGLFLTFLMDSSPQTWQQIDGPFWTLAIEWQFYMLLPLIAFCFSLLVRRFAASPLQRLKVTLLCCLGVIAWGMIIRGLGLTYQRHPNMNLLLPHAVLNVLFFFLFGIQGKYLEIFALGMIVCSCYIFAQNPEVGVALKARLQRLSNWIWGAGWIVLVCLALWQVEAETDRDATPNFTALSFLHPLRSLYAWWGEPIAGVGYALCILAILFGSPVLRWLFETRFLRWIGMLSYGIYMWHLNLMLYFSSTILPHLPNIGGTVGKDLALWGFVLLVILPISYVFYKTIEEPGIRLGARLTGKKLELSQSRSTGASLFLKSFFARFIHS
jgi:peptidoglycan/LPS O-acetylase OafA/YrhL